MVLIFSSKNYFILAGVNTIFLAILGGIPSNKSNSGVIDSDLRILRHPIRERKLALSLYIVSEKKFLSAMSENSLTKELVLPEELMEELGIKKDSYYRD